MIKLIKLVTGEEVLAKYEETDTTMTLSNPVILRIAQKGVGMVPLSPFMKENAKITIQKKDVLYLVEPDEDVINGYNSQFGGIMVAPAGLVLD